jgi:hypothetical protein
VAEGEQQQASQAQQARYRVARGPQLDHDPQHPEREQQRGDHAARQKARQALGPVRPGVDHGRRRAVQALTELAERARLERRQPVLESLGGGQRQRGVFPVEAGNLDRGVDHRLGQVAPPPLGLGGGLHLLAEIRDHLGLDRLHLAALDLHRGGRADGGPARHHDGVGGKRDQRARRDGARMDEGRRLRARGQQRVPNLHRRVDATAKRVDVQDDQVVRSGALDDPPQEGREAQVHLATQVGDDGATGRRGRRRLVRRHGTAHADGQGESRDQKPPLASPRVQPPHPAPK